MIEDIVEAHLKKKKKKKIMMKIEPVTYILMVVYAINFELPEIAKSEVLHFSGPTCLSYGYFIHILYVKVVLE